MLQQHTNPPVVVLGGDANALSVCRSLARHGVPVYVVAAEDSRVRWSRYCRWIPPSQAGSTPAEWIEYLTGPRSASLAGSVLLPASDHGIEVIADHHSELSSRYLLDECNPVAQRAMLNKLSTYDIARAAGVPTPQYWIADGATDLEQLRPSLRFPLIVKPLYSQAFEGHFGAKLFRVEDFDSLAAILRKVRQTNFEVMLVEMVPGPDDRLCSYYTYLDREGRHLFDFTKRIVRRYPVIYGNGCCHVTDWNPEVRDLALKLFQHAGLRGIANAEFKWDERDGELKLIECNARLTAANCLVARSGIDLAYCVYQRIVGRPATLPSTYRQGLRLWYPVEDLRCFTHLRRHGHLNLAGWLKTVGLRPQLPFFAWHDPLPSVVYEAVRIQRLVGRATTRLAHRTAQIMQRLRLPANRPAASPKA